MRFAFIWLAPLPAILVGWSLSALDGNADASAKPFGLDKRIPWTTSRVVGSPNPPLPYRVRRVFPKLQIPCPIAVAHEPGSDRLIVIYQEKAWTGRGHLARITDDPNVDKAEELLQI